MKEWECVKTGSGLRCEIKIFLVRIVRDQPVQMTHLFGQILKIPVNYSTRRDLRGHILSLSTLGFIRIAEI
jgi:hypothetical protein